MPYIFSLPTTSYLNFQSFLSSKTHPSLPQATSNARGVLRNVLKKHKRLPLQSQNSNLSTVLSALTEYIPYLLALDNALAAKSVAGEEIDVTLEKEIEVEWRPALSSSIPGRDPPRVRGKGLDYELFFVFTTLAYTYNALARTQIHIIYSPVTPSTEQRANAIKSATKHLRNANSVHSYLVSRSSDCKFPTQAVDISSTVQNALASLSMSEATLLAVLVDDPYIAAVIQERNKDDKEWMIKAPDIPKVRALLFARMCLASADHAGKAYAMLDRRGEKSDRADDAFVKYIEDLRRTARGKACRFFAIDADLGGKTGEGIAWLRGGKKELGFARSGKENEKMRGLAKFRKDWTEKREDRRVEKGGEWGADAGRFEEGRVIDTLEAKWVKMNDTIDVQLVPPSEPLLANLPSGRDFFSVEQYQPPKLDEDVLVKMRAPPENIDLDRGADDSDSDDAGAEARRKDPVGAFPGTKDAYTQGMDLGLYDSIEDFVET